MPVFLEKVGTVYAIVDSGANISLFQWEIAELLGLKVSSGGQISLSGIGGKIQGYLHSIPITVAGKTCRCRICFSRQLKVPLNLLGRDNFFRFFRVTFDERKKVTVLESFK